MPGRTTFVVSITVPIYGIAVAPSYDPSNPGAAVSAYGITTTPGHAMSSVSAPYAPSSTCSLEATIDSTSPVSTAAAAAPLPLNATPTDPRRADWRVRVFLGIVYRGASRLPALQKVQLLAYNKI
jgi:hypothetical protein